MQELPGVLSQRLLGEIMNNILFKYAEQNPNVKKWHMIILKGMHKYAVRFENKYGPFPDCSNDQVIQALKWAEITKQEIERRGEKIET